MEPYISYVSVSFVNGSRNRFIKDTKPVVSSRKKIEDIKLEKAN